VSNSVTPPRLVALEILRRVRTGELLDRAISSAGQRLDPRERGWTQEVVYGTLRLRGRIDHILGAFVKGGMEKLEPDVLDVLRLGVYQLLEMGSVPPYAAVSQSVELARAAGLSRAAGFVNGVLQSVRRAGGSFEFPKFDEDPVGHLATWGSHPRWLVERWVARWGPAEARALVEADNRRPDLFLRPVGVERAEAIDRLAERGIESVEVAGFPDSLRILPPAGPLEALAAVPGVIQDPAAAMVVRYADVPRGATVIDLSAAPGGKAVALAARARFVAAADISPSRLRRVLANALRTETAERIGLVAADARTPPFRPVDAVLLDAPCAGTGTLRRHVDGRWRLMPEDLAKLSALQADLLDSAAWLVRPGGLLIYATCSLEPEENEHSVERFLRDHPEFALEEPMEGMDAAMLDGGTLRLLPQRHGHDGAFAARMRRTD